MFRQRSWEKPIAVESEDWKQIAGLAEETETKFVVNTQLNFHPQNLELKRDVAEGRIGEIKFIDASARSTPVDQAPHVLQLVSSYIDNSRPVRVLGQIAGREQLDSAQPSPMHAAGQAIYENGLHVSLAFGTGMGTLASDSESTVAHKRVFVVGTKGFVHWRFSSWERATPEGGYEGGPLNYGEQDISLHKVILLRLSLTGSTMRTTYTQRISSNHSQSSILLLRALL